MTMFKITLIVSGSLELGSILMTKGVKALNVETINEVNQIEHIKELPEPSIPLKFNHPSGKTATELIVEVMKKEHPKTYTWLELTNIVKKLGFKKSTGNNVISILIKDNTIEKYTDMNKKTTTYSLTKAP